MPKKKIRQKRWNSNRVFTLKLKRECFGLEFLLISIRSVFRAKTYSGEKLCLRWDDMTSSSSFFLSFDSLFDSKKKRNFYLCKTKEFKAIDRYLLFILKTKRCLNLALRLFYHMFNLLRKAITLEVKPYSEVGQYDSILTTRKYLTWARLTFSGQRCEISSLVCKLEKFRSQFSTAKFIKILFCRILTVSVNW